MSLLDGLPDCPADRPLHKFKYMRCPPMVELAWAQEVTSMRIKGARQFSRQVCLGLFFSLYVTTFDSRCCVQQSMQLQHCLTWRLSIQLYCLHTFYWHHNSATAPNVYTVSPCPTSPLSLVGCLPLSLHPIPDASESAIVHSSTFCFLSFPVLHTIHATPGLIWNSCLVDEAHSSSI